MFASSRRSSIHLSCLLDHCHPSTHTRAFTSLPTQQNHSYYPQWSEASKFADAVGYPEGTAREADSTFFVPNNKAMQAVSGAVAKMSKEQQRDVFLYHVTSPARTVPQGGWLVGGCVCQHNVLLCPACTLPMPDCPKLL